MNNPTKGIGQKLEWSTNPAHSSEQRLVQWQGVLSELILPVAAEMPVGGDQQDFSGCLRMGQFGPAAWLELSSSAQWLHRGEAEITGSEGRWLFTSTMTRGHGWLHADGNRLLVRTGQTVFVDSAQHFSLEFDTDFAFASAMLPRNELLVHQPYAPAAHATMVTDPVGPALHAFLAALAGHASSPECAALASRQQLFDHFVGLILSAVEPLALAVGRSQPTAQERLLSNIRVALLAALPQPDLGSGWIARRFGLSERSVQRLFQAEGTTVPLWLLEQRLSRCAADLADPELGDYTIGEIAFRWGFSDLSYFSRRFGRRFGLRPSEYRSQQLARPGV